VVLVDSADELNPNAANALLKSLEEPPAQTLFLLITSEPGALLPTIRSRCRRLDLAPLASNPLRRATTAALEAADLEAPPAGDWARLERLAEGSARRALQLASTDGLALYGRVEAIFAGLPRIDWSAAHALADQLSGGGQDQRFRMFYDLLLDLMARLVRKRAAGPGDDLETGLAVRAIAESGLPAWARLWAELVREKNDAYILNLDRKALLIGTLARLESVARG
jgi:DNA polymerase-3 subunit delta'